MAVTTENLPQLYRFCFLMTGDAAKAQAAFQDTVREAATRAASDEPPPDRLWFFKDARWRCQALGEQGIQAEPGMMEEVEISPSAPIQIEQLEPAQLALWISAAVPFSSLVSIGGMVASARPLLRAATGHPNGFPSRFRRRVDLLQVAPVSRAWLRTCSVPRRRE